MRLDEQEKKAFFKTIQGVASVHLFGLHTDDNARGGNIDILIYSREPAFELSRRIARDFFLECEEKIDVFVVNPDKITVEQQAFISSLNLRRIH